MKASGANPFVDPEEYRSYVAEREKAFRAEWRSSLAVDREFGRV
jgi:hypothetical protein